MSFNQNACVNCSLHISVQFHYVLDPIIGYTIFLNKCTVFYANQLFSYTTEHDQFWRYSWTRKGHIPLFKRKLIILHKCGKVHETRHHLEKMSNLYQSNFCALCFEQYTDENYPACLPCGHVLCHTCTLQLDPSICPLGNE